MIQNLIVILKYKQILCNEVQVDLLQVYRNYNDNYFLSNELKVHNEVLSFN